MISKGAGVSKPVIRGLAMNDVLTLNNGVRYENYQYSDHHPLGIEEFGVGEVEVIKGPASLLYGSDAIGGVVNFLKEKPAPAGKVLADYNLNLFSNSLGVVQDFGCRGAGQNIFGGLRFGQKTQAIIYRAAVFVRIPH
jgi:iron complex outermembrane receptor protein